MNLTEKLFCFINIIMFLKINVFLFNNEGIKVNVNFYHDSIQFSKCVGTGEFGRVFLGEIECLNSNMSVIKQKIAVKEMINTSLGNSRLSYGFIIDKNKLGQFGYEETTLFKEISIMKKLGYHVNIVTLMGYCRRGSNESKSICAILK